MPIKGRAIIFKTSSGIYIGDYFNGYFYKDSETKFKESEVLSWKYLGE